MVTTVPILSPPLQPASLLSLLQKVPPTHPMDYTTHVHMQAHTGTHALRGTHASAHTHMHAHTGTLIGTHSLMP